jgi:Malectin domain
VKPPKLIVALVRPCCAALVLSMLVPLPGGCQNNKSDPPKPSSASVAKPAPAPAKPAIRIDAGAAAKWTDSAGHPWLADTGFADGQTVERDATLAIANTSEPAIYRTERFGMTAFSHSLPSGKYKVKLHFAETSSAISAVGERVFSINIEGVQVNDLDIWAKAGAREKAYVHSVDVEVSDGKLDITFTAKTQNTAINGIEIIPS